MTETKITPLEGWIAKKIEAKNFSLPALRQYQVQALRQVVAYAKENAVFYRNLYQGIDPFAIHALADFAKLPLIDESHLRLQGNKMLCVEQEEISRIVSLLTSGTTQQPKRVYFTEADQNLTVDFFENGMQTMTGKGEAVWILLPVARIGSVGDLLAKGLENFGAVPVRYGVPLDFWRTAKEMAAQPADLAVANPVQMLAIGHCYQQLLQQGQVAPGSIRLKGILLSTDYVATALAKQLEQLFDCPVYEHYGMTEMGLGGGVSCSALTGYHLREADLYVEVVQPDSGIPVAEGEFGEVVFSTLTRKGMPLIRYRTGDWGRFLPGQCPCGSQLPRLDKITYRLQQQHPIPITNLDEMVFALPQIFYYDAAYEAKNKRLFLEVFHIQPLPQEKLLQLQETVEQVCSCQVRIKSGGEIPPGLEQLRKRSIKQLP